MTEGLHVVFGTGPAGRATASALHDMGLSVRVVNRSGDRPEGMPEAIDVVAVTDASDPVQASKAAEGAACVYQCLNPPYTQWPQLFPGLQAGAVAAAKAAGATYVSMENLYMYGPVEDPITEDLPPAAKTRKGGVRAEMANELLAMNRSGDLKVVIARASDYYGPTVTASAMGARTFEPLIAGKPAEATGDPDQPHSFAYIGDVGSALAVLGTREEALGQVWHVPHAHARTQREMIYEAQDIAGVKHSLRGTGPITMTIAGLFVPEARETVEMMYEFMKPFVVDSTKIEQTFGLMPTPIDEGLAATVAWYQERAKA